MMVVAGLAGCAANPAPREGDPAAMSVAPGQYATMFDAARHTLRDRGFILERVDAQAGVITTQPKTTAGLVTPWDREQQSLAQEAEDLLERQQRVVSVTFEPSAQVAAPSEPAAADEAPGSPPDLRASTEPFTMRVHVILQRLQIPGRKLEPEAIGQSSYFWDPALGERGMQPQYVVAIRQDSKLAERLAALIDEASRSPARP